jgi:hypothetical protein
VVKSYSEVEIFDQKAVEAMEVAYDVVERLRDGLRCHEVVRIVHVALRHAGYNSIIVDGHYGVVEHSWLLVQGKRENYAAWVILDPYAVGRLPLVQLVSPSLGLHELYRPNRDKKNEMFCENTRQDLDGNAIDNELRRLGYPV